ncbi:MAG: 50S ribosomal protein L21 [Clostridium sp.]|jgi:large subunit ribosomal protein L21|nr:50S ribosomal protein L21 [Clostridium sp.]MBP3216525.1 50S ribosomal protein L21 [Clostridium sp.]MBQ4149027.1 50S ribosomal protein L21 [Clostridium sp.]MBQ5420917.1 50S ribosomal protein L21 [Clostridium sp.]HAE81524.1 50S ribosomal protein L21 [Lachnoclostridium sp.]
MYAIIATGGKQYKVAEGDVIRVEKLGVDAGQSVTFDQVLVVSNDAELKIGTPVVDGASVTATVVKEGKAKKVIVYKYKPKTGYHKKNGHRQLFTEVKIEKINA